MLHILDASYVSDFRVHLSFNDGSEGTIDLSDSLDGPVFEPLRNKSRFSELFVEGHTVCWPNGADFAPEYLKSLLNSQVQV